jgi:hypothetical protein
MRLIIQDEQSKLNASQVEMTSELIDLIKNQSEIGHKESIFILNQLEERITDTKNLLAIHEQCRGNKKDNPKSLIINDFMIDELRYKIRELEMVKTEVLKILCTYFPTPDLIEVIQKRTWSDDPAIKTGKYFLAKNKDNPSPPLITIDKAHIEDIIKDLLIHVLDQEVELREILTNQALDKVIQFQGNQKTLVISFRKYKNLSWIAGNQNNLCQWLCDHFTFIFQRGTIRETRPLNRTTVWSYLTKEDYG